MSIQLVTITGEKIAPVSANTHDAYERRRHQSIVSSEFLVKQDVDI
ncbi:MAG: hypothetical protein ABT940_02595 [Alphaproteobacteria bacterium]